MNMTAEMECLERAVACVRMLKEILVAAAGVNDYPDIPGQPRADESMKAIADIRRIVTEGRLDILGIAGISEAFFADGRRNNNQIDGTSYYRLPCGLFLEDFIDWNELDFKWGSAVKYEYRAGAKDGEPEDKDRRKRDHYVSEIAARERCDPGQVLEEVKRLAREAREWNPSQKTRDWYAPHTAAAKETP